jgi:hypothetical protein
MEAPPIGMKITKCHQRGDREARLWLLPDSIGPESSCAELVHAGVVLHRFIGTRREASAFYDGIVLAIQKEDPTP